MTERIEEGQGEYWPKCSFKFAHFMMIHNDQHQTMLPNDDEATKYLQSVLKVFVTLATLTIIMIKNDNFCNISKSFDDVLMA